MDTSRSVVAGTRRRSTMTSGAAEQGADAFMNEPRQSSERPRGGAVGARHRLDPTDLELERRPQRGASCGMRSAVEAMPGSGRAHPDDHLNQCRGPLADCACLCNVT
jgi:hypothetical protein